MFKLLKLPDIISMVNGFFGLSAILLLIFDFGLPQSVKFHSAFVLILLGLLADGLDGMIARKFGKGILGDFFEAMSDMTTMGITPTVFLAIRYQSTLSQEIVHYAVLWLLLLFYLAAAFIRLASFHPLKTKQVFVGFPASATTMLLLSTSIFFESIYLLFITILITAILMVLPIPFPKPTKSMNIMSVIIVFFTIIVGFFSTAVYLLLLASVLIYLIGGQVYLYFFR